MFGRCVDGEGVVVGVEEVVVWASVDTLGSREVMSPSLLRVSSRVDSVPSDHMELAGCPKRM